MELYKKLHKIQKAVTALKKNAQGHGYQYLNGEKLLDHIKPLMNEHGLLLKQEILSIENERMDYTTGTGKPKSEILSRVMLRFTWIDSETGEKDENLFGANGQNDWDKGVGSALTYGERYFLLKFFHIATDEDDVDNPINKAGKEDPQPSKPKQQPAKPATLPELTPSHEKWQGAAQSLADGKTTIENIRKYFTLTEENKSALVELATEIDFNQTQEKNA